MPKEPPQLPRFDEDEQQLYSVLLPDGETTHPISKDYPSQLLKGAVSEFLAQSRACLQCMLDSDWSALCHRSWMWRSRAASRGVVGERRASGLGTSELHLCFLRMM